MLNKPIYVVFTVLELSKWLIYDFHYNFIKKDFDAELLFTDTDSLTYEIKPKDVYILQEFQILLAPIKEHKESFS